MLCEETIAKLISIYNLVICFSQSVGQIPIRWLL